MKNNNNSENHIERLIFFLIMVAIGIYFLISTTNIREKSEKYKTTRLQDTEVIMPIQNLVEGFDKNFIPQYYPIAGSEEDLSKHFQSHKLFTQNIYVQVGLSEKELKQNLIHAAWKLQKIKNGAETWIYAYRADDAKRDGGYSAGYCTLPQYSEWAQSTEKRPISFFNNNIAIDSIYFKNTPRYKITQQVIINANNTKLFNNSDCNPSQFITILNKGTKAIVIDRLRNFIKGGRSFAITFKDIYKIRINLSKNNIITGWVSSSVLDEVQDSAEHYKNQKIQMTQKKNKRNKKK